MRMLVFDEEKYWRDMALEHLEQEGFRVELAVDVAHLETKLARCPDVIVLGFPAVESRQEQIIAYARKKCPGALLAVFSTSWPMSQSTERRLLRLGVSEMLGRPGQGSDLVTAIKSAYVDHHARLASLSSLWAIPIEGGAMTDRRRVLIIDDEGEWQDEAQAYPDV